MRIRISNLHPKATTPLLYELVSQLCLVKSIKLNNQIAKVEFYNFDDLKYIYDVLNNILIYNQPIQISLLNENEILILLQNLNKEITEIDIYRLINPPLCRVIRENGVSKKTAFLTYFNYEDSDKCIDWVSKNSLNILGDNILCDYAIKNDGMKFGTKNDRKVEN